MILISILKKWIFFYYFKFKIKLSFAKFAKEICKNSNSKLKYSKNWKLKPNLKPLSIFGCTCQILILKSNPIFTWLRQKSRLETPRLAGPSSAAYSSTVTTDHLSRETIHSSGRMAVEVEVASEPALLTLDSLLLTNECVSDLSRERLLAQINRLVPVVGFEGGESLESSYRSDASSQVSNPVAEFVKNAKRITRLDLKHNKSVLVDYFFWNCF